MDKNPLWEPRHKSYTETIQYLKDRREGKIKSLLTPWSRLNQATINGLEWGNVLLLAARAGVGKSLWREQFIRESFKLNPEQNHRVLELEWEMPSIVSNIRELSSQVKKSYQAMCSAGNAAVEDNLTEKELQNCIKYLHSKLSKTDSGWDSRIDTIQIPLTPKEFEDTCEKYFETYPNSNVLVTVDHIRLGERGGKTEQDMLYDFSRSLIKMKLKKRNDYKNPSFIILNHLNRNIDLEARCEEGKYGNYARDSDIMGSDNLLQACDVAIALDCPAQRQIKYYGPSRFIIEDDKILVANYLKVRNGAKGICFNRANYENMEIVEIDTPPKAQQRISTK